MLAASLTGGPIKSDSRNPSQKGQRNTKQFVVGRLSQSRLISYRILIIGLVCLELCSVSVVFSVSISMPRMSKECRLLDPFHLSLFGGGVVFSVVAPPPPALVGPRLTKRRQAGVTDPERRRAMRVGKLASIRCRPRLPPESFVPPLGASRGNFVLRQRDAETHAHSLSPNCLHEELAGEEGRKPLTPSTPPAAPRCGCFNEI